MRFVLACVCLLIASPAAAQLAVVPKPVDTSTLASKAEVQAAAIAAASACQPMATIPPSESVGGSAGSGTACRLANAVQPRISRAASVSTASDGTWSVTWSQALDAVPAVLPIPVNATATQAIVCNVTSRTTTAAAGKCWQAMAPAILSITVATNPLPAVGAGVSVQVFAIPATQ